METTKSQIYLSNFVANFFKMQYKYGANVLFHNYVVLI